MMLEEFGYATWQHGLACRLIKFTISTVLDMAFAWLGHRTQTVETGLVVQHATKTGTEQGYRNLRDDGEKKEKPGIKIRRDGMPTCEDRSPIIKFLLTNLSNMFYSYCFISFI